LLQSIPEAQQVSEPKPGHNGSTPSPKANSPSLAVIYKYAGQDASEVYNEVHSPSLISSTLEHSKLIGRFDSQSVDDEWLKPPPRKSKELAQGIRPALDSLLNSYDFEQVAEKIFSPKTWAFYASAATDLITQRANKSFFDRIWFRPRGLIDVKTVRTSSKILGHDVSLPLAVAPAALAKLAHPEGEKAIARGCARAGIPYCVSTAASFRFPEIAEAAPDAVLYFQLYVNQERHKSELLIAEAEKAGARAIFLTIDAPFPGKREADERVRADESITTANGGKATNDAKGGGLARTTAAFIDPSLNWSDLKWIRSCTKLPLVLKGIQGAADAKMALDAGVDGVLVSNHGGRSLDTAPPSVLMLLEIHKQFPEVFDGMEVYLDGGIRRGTDLLKAISLGVTAVFVGRPYLYSLAYGQEGVEHLTESE
jgi:L-lactate dehydrogenase (cytochrome)